MSPAQSVLYHARRNGSHTTAERRTNTINYTNAPFPLLLSHLSYEESYTRTYHFPVFRAGNGQLLGAGRRHGHERQTQLLKSDSTKSNPLSSPYPLRHSG